MREKNVFINQYVDMCDNKKLVSWECQKNQMKSKIKYEILNIKQVGMTGMRIIQFKH